MIQPPPPDLERLATELEVVASTGSAAQRTETYKARRLRLIEKWRYRAWLNSIDVRAWPRALWGVRKMTDKDGGPAFSFSHGLTLRDWFAGQALAGLSAVTWETFTTTATLAQLAYQLADAMLAERAKAK